MEHRKKGRKLKRTASHRRALLSNLSVALIVHKRIKTTLAKAKELRTFIEPVVTKAIRALSSDKISPEPGIHQRRVVRRFLNDKEALNILFDEIAPKVAARPGGYTRVLKTGFRAGDGAEEAIIEFVDYSVVEKESSKKKDAKETQTKDKSEEHAAEDKKPATKKTGTKKPTFKKETKPKTASGKTSKKEDSKEEPDPEKPKKKPLSKVKKEPSAPKTKKTKKEE